MNTGKYLIAGVTAGVWLFFYGWVVNGIVLSDFWAAQGNEVSMRPEEQLVMWAIAASCLLQGLALGFIFTRGYENRGIGEGVRFGLMVAWFVAALYLLFYALQPYTLQATFVSMVVDGLMYVGAGVILALLYRN